MADQIWDIEINRNTKQATQRWNVGALRLEIDEDETGWMLYVLNSTSGDILTERHVTRRGDVWEKVPDEHLRGRVIMMAFRWLNKQLDLILKASDI